VQARRTGRPVAASLIISSFSFPPYMYLHLQPSIHTCNNKSCCDVHGDFFVVANATWRQGHGALLFTTSLHIQ